MITTMIEAHPSTETPTMAGGRPLIAGCELSHAARDGLSRHAYGSDHMPARARLKMTANGFDNQTPPLQRGVQVSDVVFVPLDVGKPVAVRDL